MLYTRRDIGKIVLAAVPGATLLPDLTFQSKTAKPNSKVNGVQIGLNAPYNFGDLTLSGDEVLQRTVQLGISGLELRSQPAEVFAGVPAELINRRRAGQPAPDEAAQKAAADELQKRRLALPMSKFKEFRKKYEDAGVLIEIVKFDNIYAQSDDVLDYFFELARTLGGRAISCEISKNLDDTKRLGQFADKHKMMVGYHGHTETGPPDWEKAMTYAKYNGVNLDLGHFVAGLNTSPIPFLKQHHDRITHVHVKDRKSNNGPNVPFGEGDTPIKEALQLIRDNKWNIQATIEFEYPVPPGSDRMKEMAKAIEYCRTALA
jgi:sugar phosphate isomerase/epimerase